jgi:hypothetical protein
MIEEEDETKTTYVSTTSSKKPTRKMYSGQLRRIIGIKIIFVYYAHVYTRNNNVVLIITESLNKSRRVL